MPNINPVEILTRLKSEGRTISTVTLRGMLNDVTELTERLHNVQFDNAEEKDAAFRIVDNLKESIEAYV